MLQTKIIKSLDGKRDLIETSTTLSSSKKLLQVETNKIYFEKATDVIVNGKSKYSYKEINKTQEDLAVDKRILELEGGII